MKTPNPADMKLVCKALLRLATAFSKGTGLPLSEALLEIVKFVAK